MNLKSSLLWLKRNAGLYNFSRISNPIYDLFIGGSNREVFFDIDKTFPELRKLDAAFPEIQKELEQLLPQQDAMPRYHDIDTNVVNSSGRFNRKSRWNVFMLFCYDSLPKQNRELCPRTCEALSQIPYLNQAFFSILDPGKSIPAHTGPTRAYIRYYLALKVPDNNPPSMRVKDTWYTWKEGESILFDDSWNHEIVNHSDGVRAILLVDVMRPFPQPIFLFNRIFRNLGVRFYGRARCFAGGEVPASPSATK
jgi:aspartyl/asparaginyl beta-hydroxylase (cupin superfamily)